MRETILAGEEIEEFSLRKRAACFAFAFAELAGFTEDLFVRNGPCRAGDGQRQEEKKSELMQERYV